MTCIGVVVGLRPQLTNVVEHFVFAFSRHLSIWNLNSSQVLIERVRIALVLHEEVQLFAQVTHELSARWDRVRVKKFGQRFSLSLNLLLQKGSFSSTPESSCPLLVHFCAWSHSIYSQEEMLLGFHDVDHFVDGAHDRCPQLLHVVKSTDALVPLRIIPVHTIVHNSVQIQI